jgi:ribonuclease HI
MIQENDDIFQDFIKEARNPYLFYKNNFFLYNPYKNDYEYANLTKEQNILLEAFENSNRICLLKSRQKGVTSVLALYVARILMFSIEKNIAVIVPIAERSHFIKKVSTILRQHKTFDVKEYKATVSSLKYQHSSLHLFTDSKDVMRGFSIDYLIFEEADCIRNFKEIWCSLAMVTNARCGKVILSSSDNGPSYKFVKEIFDTCEKEQKRFKRKILLEIFDKKNTYDLNQKHFKLIY